MPAGLPRLFKSALDWNLYSTQQHDAADRQVCASGKLNACPHLPNTPVMPHDYCCRM